jgi:hypothetical protein
MRTITETGLTRSAEIRQRSVRIRGLPPRTQEGLLQQSLDKIASVKRVEIFEDKREAVVELESAAVCSNIPTYRIKTNSTGGTQEAGKLLLRTEPIMFNDHTLQLSDEGRSESSAPSKAGGMFVPRKAGPSLQKAGLGLRRVNAKGESSTEGVARESEGTGGAKVQDDFRKLLMGRKR